MLPQRGVLARLLILWGPPSVWKQIEPTTLPKAQLSVASVHRWRPAERRRPTGRERMDSPTCRHFKNQSCCCPGSAFEGVAFRPLFGESRGPTTT
jgi:hypothetical protein